MKAIFGEYSAFTTRNTVRYMQNSRIVSEKSVPPEVVAYLNKQLGYTPPPAPELPPRTFAPPTEEEKKKLREESLKVPPELQTESSEAPLTPEDFDTPPPAEHASVPKPETEPSEPELPPTQEILDEETPEHPTEKAVRETKEEMSDFMESVSIHTAPLEEIALALYNRFGLYTVYLNKLPEADEFNPLTGEQFTKYHLGIAYQAAIRAQSHGILERPAEMGRAAIDEGRAASQNFQVDPAPQTMGDARRANSFEYRTSPQGTRTVPRTEIVHEKGADGQLHAIQREIPEGETGEFNGARARYDADEEQPLVEPNFSGRPVIRPNW